MTCSFVKWHRRWNRQCSSCISSGYHCKVKQASKKQCKQSQTWQQHNPQSRRRHRSWQTLKEFIGKGEDAQQRSRTTESFPPKLTGKYLIWRRCVSRYTRQLMALTNHEANDTVANSRENLLEASRKVKQLFGQTTGGWIRDIPRTTIYLGRCAMHEIQAGDMGIVRISFREETEEGTR